MEYSWLIGSGGVIHPKKINYLRGGKTTKRIMIIINKNKHRLPLCPSWWPLLYLAQYIDIRGNMWHHLRARFDKIKLRVLRPGISARHTVDILRGLPKGSRLSPTLFGILVADLVHELRVKFPLRLFTLDTHSQTHTPFDPDLQRTSGLEVCSMLMT